MEVAVRQGEKTGRPCKLGLRVDAAARIFVTGAVVDIGGGALTLD